MSLMCHRSFDPFESPHGRIFHEVPAGNLIKGDVKAVNEWINNTSKESTKAAKELAEQVNAQVEAIKDGTRSDLVKLYVDVFTENIPSPYIFDMSSTSVDDVYKKKGLLEVLEKNCPVLKAAFKAVPDLRLLAYGNIYKEMKASTPPMDANYLPIGSEVWMEDGKVFIKQPSGKVVGGLLFPWDVYEIARGKYPAIVKEEAEEARPEGEPAIDLGEEPPAVPPVPETPPPVPPVPEAPTEPSPWDLEPAPPAVEPPPVSEPTPEAPPPVLEPSLETVAEDPLEKDWETRVVPVINALKEKYSELTITHENLTAAPAHSKIVRFKNTATGERFDVMVVMPTSKKNVPETYAGKYLHLQIIRKHPTDASRDEPVFLSEASDAQKKGDVVNVLNIVARKLVASEMIDTWLVEKFNELTPERQLYYLNLFSQRFRKEALDLERSRKPSWARYNFLVDSYTKLEDWHKSLQPWISGLPSPSSDNNSEEFQRTYKNVKFDLDNPNDPMPEDAGMRAILERMRSRISGATTALPAIEGVSAGAPTPELSPEAILQAKQARIREAAAVLRMPDLLNVGALVQAQISILLQSYRDDTEFTSAVDTLMQNYPQVEGKTFGRISFHQLNPPDATGVRSVIVEVETTQGSVIFKAEVLNAKPAAVQEYVAAHADLGNTLTPGDVAELSAFLNLKYQFELAMSIHKTQLDDFYAAYKAKMTEAPLPTSREGVAAEATHLRGVMDAAGSSHEQVNAAYERLLNLYIGSPENLSRQDHFKGARAAFALGDAQKAYERFQNAEHVATDPETIQYVEGIENRFGHVHITIPRGQQGDFELLPHPDPIDDALDYAIAFANKKLNETRTFDGFLPVSTWHDGSNLIRYNYGSQTVWFNNLKMNSGVQEAKLKREKLGAGGSGTAEAEPTWTANEVLLSTPRAATPPEAPARIPAVTPPPAREVAPGPIADAAVAAEMAPAVSLAPEERQAEISRIKEELKGFTDVWFKRASINLTNPRTGQRVERYLRPDSVYKDRLRVLETQLDPNNREHQELQKRLEKIKTFQMAIADLYEELGSVEVFISQITKDTMPPDIQAQQAVCKQIVEKTRALQAKTEFIEMHDYTDLLSPEARQFVTDFYSNGANPLILETVSKDMVMATILSGEARP